MKKILALLLFALIPSLAVADYPDAQKVEVAKVLTCGVNSRLVQSYLAEAVATIDGPNHTVQLLSSLEDFRVISEKCRKALGVLIHAPTSPKSIENTEDPIAAFPMIADATNRLNNATSTLGSLNGAGGVAFNMAISNALLSAEGATALMETFDASLPYPREQALTEDFPCVAGRAVDGVNCLHGDYLLAQWQNQDAMFYGAKFLSKFYDMNEAADTFGDAAQRSFFLTIVRTANEAFNTINLTMAHHVRICPGGPCTPSPNSLVRTLDLIDGFADPVTPGGVANQFFQVFLATSHWMERWPFPFTDDKLAGSQGIIRELGDAWKFVDRWLAHVSDFEHGIPGVDFATRQQRIDELEAQIDDLEAQIAGCGGQSPTDCSAEEAELARLRQLLMDVIGVASQR